MKTVVLAAAKGGVGKTTLAAALSAAATIAQPEAKVGLLDLDPQGSLTRWWNARAQPQPMLLNAAGARLLHTPSIVLDEDLDLLILDCPPGFSPILKRAIATADLVLVPTGPSEVDLEAVESTAVMAERIGVPFSFILNRALYRSRLAGHAVSRLRERGDLLPPVHQRVAIATAMADGRTAMETEPSGAAARELTALWRAVLMALGTALVLGNDPTMMTRWLA